MPIRLVSQPTDRGSIKDLAHTNEHDMNYKEISLTPSELRYKKLYEYAENYKDNSLISALGIITTGYISDKNALPLSVYRLRKKVKEIKSKSGSQINKLEMEFSEYLTDPISPKLADFVSNKKLIKTAGACRSPIFRRVSEK